MRLSKTPVEFRMPPPTLGQHTEGILHDRLKLDTQAIEQLRQKGII
jgi:formyl-CoA transferase